MSKNEFDFHEIKPVGGTHFHMNGFTLRLVVTQTQKATQKWPIGFGFTPEWMKKWHEFFLKQSCSVLTQDQLPFHIQVETTL